MEKSRVKNKYRLQWVTFRTIGMQCVTRPDSFYLGEMTEKEAHEKIDRVFKDGALETGPVYGLTFQKVNLESQPA